MSIASSKASSGPDFISALIDDQQSLTAVERFSALHETGEIPHEGPAQEKYYRDLLPASPPSPNEQFAFEVDLDKCSGCKACVVACHTMNGLEEDESWRQVGTLTIGAPAEEPASHSATLQLPMIQHVTTACHHCEDPGCLNGCPVRAYEKDPVTGIVRHLDDQCIGCKYCTMMCPYEVPQYSERLGIVRKCDMCHQRLSVGEAPACVQACPNEAIAIRSVPREQSFSATDRIAPGAAVSTITKPTTQYIGRDLDPAISIPQDQGVDEAAESHWPLAVMLVATQISVGMIAIERLVTGLIALTGGTVSDSVVRWNTTLALLIGIVGLNLAPLHLGQPLRAWRVFLGLRTSWLSREAIVLGKYVGLLSVAVSLLWMPVVEEWVPEFVTSMIPTWAGSITLALAIPVGVIGLYCSAMIYVATRRQLWRTPRTLNRFFGTTLVSGMAFVAAVYAGGGNSTVAALIGISTVIALAAKLIFEYRILLQPATNHDKTDEFARFDERSKTLVRRDLWSLVQARTGTALFGGAALLLGAVVAPFASVAGCVLLTVGALLISAGELGERLLYFTSVVYDRMPGTLR